MPRSASGWRFTSNRSEPAPRRTSLRRAPGAWPLRCPRSACSPAGTAEVRRGAEPLWNDAFHRLGAERQLHLAVRAPRVVAAAVPGGWPDPAAPAKPSRRVRAPWRRWPDGSRPGVKASASSAAPDTRRLRASRPPTRCAARRPCSTAGSRTSFRAISSAGPHPSPARGQPPGHTRSERSAGLPAAPPSTGHPTRSPCPAPADPA